MRSVPMIILLAASAPAPAKELLENHTGVETLMHMLVDRLVDKVVGKLVNGELKAWQSHHADLHQKMMEQHGNLALFPSHNLRRLHVFDHYCRCVGRDVSGEFNFSVSECLPSRRAALCTLSGMLTTLKASAAPADAPVSSLEESVMLLGDARSELLSLLDRLALTMVSTGLKRQQAFADVKRILNGGDLGDLRRICERTDKFLGEVPLRGFKVQLKQYEDQVKSYESQVKRQLRDQLAATAKDLPWRPRIRRSGTNWLDLSDVPLSTSLLLSLRLFADGVDLAAQGDPKMTDAGLERLADDTLKKLDAYIKLAESRRQLAGLQNLLSKAPA